jgi:hypothetical protein
MTKFLLIAILSAVVFTQAGWAMDITRIAVFRSGVIEIDGSRATLADLRIALARVKEKHGGVWYYREGGSAEPTGAQMDAFKSLVEARVPISLSSKPDFSDYIGPDGQSHLRN